MSRRALREPVDVERHVAERMRREYESGATQAPICRGLNADGIRTPQAGRAATRTWKTSSEPVATCPCARGLRL